MRNCSANFKLTNVIMAMNKKNNCGICRNETSKVKKDSDETSATQYEQGRLFS